MTHKKTTVTLKTPSRYQLSTVDDIPISTNPMQSGFMIGQRYRLERFLGRGGMGEVWLASEMGAQDTVIQQVVLKVVPPELQRSRFEMAKIQESFELVRKLRHPNICSALTFALDEQYGYFLVMDYVPGIELSELQLQQPGGVFTFDQTVEILAFIATALDYAHRKKIIHRDIKPQNVMVPVEDGQPQIDELKLIDFGLASQYHSTQSCDVEHESLSISGTLPYMPPEQISGSHQDSRTDQYALGVMAYEMLSGRLPFTSVAPAVLMHKVINSPPDNLDQVPPHVNSVLCRVMAKDRRLRYDSCADFVTALKSGRMEKPTPLGICSQENLNEPEKSRLGWVVAAIALVLLTATATLGWVVVQKYFNSHVAKNTVPVTVIPKNDTNPVSPVEEPQAVVPVVVPEAEPDPVRTKRRIVALAHQDWVVSFHDVDSGRRCKNINFQGAVTSIDISPDGRSCACAVGGRIDMRNISNGGSQYTIAAHSYLGRNSLKFSPDGKTLYSCGSGDSFIKAWNPVDGSLIREIPAFEKTGSKRLALSNDGHLLACAADNEKIVIVDTADGKVVQSWPCALPRQLSFSRDNARLLVAQVDASNIGSVQLWDVASGKQILSLPASGKECLSACFSPDEKYILSAGGANSIHLWDVESRTLVRRYDGHDSTVSTLTFLPDGKQFVSSSANGRAFLWDVQSGNRSCEMRLFNSWVHQVCLYPDTINDEQTNALFSAPETPLLPQPESEPLPSLDGRSLIAVSAAADNTVQIRDKSSDEILRVFPGKQAKLRFSPVISPDGKIIAIPYDDSSCRVFEINSGKLLFERADLIGLNTLFFSPDGSCINILISPGWRYFLRLDANTGETLTSFCVAAWNAFTATQSPDGARNYTIGKECGHNMPNFIRKWDSTSNRRIGEWTIPQSLRKLICSRDGKTLIGLANPDKEGKFAIRFWNAETGEQIRELYPDIKIGNELALSSDEKALYITEQNGDCVLIDALTGKRITTMKESGWFRALSSDGKELITGRDGVCRLWNAETMKQIREYKNLSSGSFAVFVPDGRDFTPPVGPTMADVLRERKQIQEEAAIADFPVPLSAQELAAARKSVADQLAAQAAAPDGKKKEIVWPAPFGAFIPPTNLPSLEGRNLLATAGSNDGLVKIWDGKTGEKLRIFQAVPATGLQSTYSLLAWSPDGKRLVAATTGGFINVWDAATGKKLVEITENEKSTPSIILFDKEGKRIISAVENSGVVRVWNADNGKLLAEMKHDAPIYVSRADNSSYFASCLSEDGALLVVSYDQVCGVVAWDLNFYKKKHEWKTSSAPLHPFLLDGNKQLMHAQYDTAVIGNLETGKQVRTLPPFRYGNFTQNMGEKDLFCTYDYDSGRFMVFNVQTGDIVQYWRCGRGKRFTSLSDDKNSILVKGYGETLLYDLPSGDRVLTLRCHAGDVSDAKFSPTFRSTYQPTPFANGKECVFPQGLKPYEAQITPKSAQETFDPQTDVITGSWDGMIYRINVRTGKIVWTAKPLTDMRRIQLSPDGKLVSVSGIGAGRVAILDAETGAVVKTFGTFYPTCSSFSPDGKSILVSGARGRKELEIINLDTGEKKLLASDAISSHMNAWSPDGKYIAYMKDQKQIVILNIETGETEALFDIIQGDLEGIDWSADGQWLAAGTKQIPQVFLYNFTTKALTKLDGCQNGVQYLAFSPDSKFVAAADRGTQVHLWDVSTGEKKQTFSGHTNRSTSVFFSEDGKRLISSSDDKTVRIWDVETGKEELRMEGLLFECSALFVLPVTKSAPPAP